MPQKTVRFIRSREELENLLITMHRQGWSIRSLCRHFGMGRNSVRRVLRENEHRRDKGCDALAICGAPRKSKIEPYLVLMKQILDEFPEVTGVRMHEKLMDAGFDGGKTIVFDRLRQLRPRSKRAPVVRFETGPGEQAQMDWSPYTIAFTGEARRTVLCFSYILGFSRRQYIDFTKKPQFFHFDPPSSGCI